LPTFEQYLGKPWALPCQPPHSYDCWEFAIEIRRAFFGRGTPVTLELERRTTEAAAQFFSEPPDAWRDVPNPRPGNLLLFGGKHCGVLLEGGRVAHCWTGDGKTGSVRYDPLPKLERLYGAPRAIELKPRRGDVHA
jgi:hypothetical protein